MSSNGDMTIKQFCNNLAAACFIFMTMLVSNTVMLLRYLTYILLFIGIITIATLNHGYTFGSMIITLGDLIVSFSLLLFLFGTLWSMYWKPAGVKTIPFMLRFIWHRFSYFYKNTFNE